jgi:hypothetical protein
MTLDDRNSGKEDGLIELFLNPHYFQAHFQYIHDNTRQLQDELANGIISLSACHTFAIAYKANENLEPFVY